MKQKRLFRLDLPKLGANHQLRPGLHDNIPIDGWIIDETRPITAVGVVIDSRDYAPASFPFARNDVAAHFPAFEGAASSGFRHLVRCEELDPGIHTLSIVAFDQGGCEVLTTFTFDISEDKGPDSIQQQLRVQSSDHVLRCVLVVDASQSDGQIQKLRRDNHLVDLNVLYILGRAEGVVRCSTGSDIIYDIDESSLVAECILTLFGNELNECWVVFVKATDVISDQIMIELMTAGSQVGRLGFVYADELKFDVTSKLFRPFYKPGWSPHTLNATNYVGRPWAASIELANHSKLQFRHLLSFHALESVLRLTQSADAIAHLSKVLLRRTETDTNAEGDRSSLQLVFDCLYHPARVQVNDGLFEGAFSLRVDRETEPLVSVIIPTKGIGGLLERCVTSIRDVVRYSNIEIIGVQNGHHLSAIEGSQITAHVDRLIQVPGSFNWSRVNNIGAHVSSGEFFMFLNDDTIMIDPDCISRLVDEMVDARVGCVGPQLIYRDGTVQHSGIVLTSMSRLKHAFRHFRCDEPGYFGFNLLRRNVIALTGACMLVRADAFNRVGGFDEAFPLTCNDVDLCFKMLECGFWNVYTPHTKVLHHERTSRGWVDEGSSLTALLSKWSEFVDDGDPFLHSRLNDEDDVRHRDVCAWE